MKAMWVSSKGKKMALANDIFKKDVASEAGFLEEG